MSTAVIHLNGLVLDRDAGLARKDVRPEDRRTPHYQERYDRHTLIYDAVQCGDDIVVTAPRFLNLWDAFSRTVSIDGETSLSKKREKWLRTEQVTLRGQTGRDLVVNMEGKLYGTQVRASAALPHAGTNALLAVNKNNRLEWLHDWAGMHAHLHGAQTVALFDNGSTDYTVQEAADALAAAPGIDHATVISAPFPYGPTDRGGRFDVSPRFFQTGMFAIARRDVLSEAKAVLSVDIDEIVRPMGSTTVFEAAAASRFGLVSFRGFDVLSSDNTKAQGHAAHTHVFPGRKAGNTKWCLTRGGFMDRFGWAVHRFGGAFFQLTETEAFNFLHCRGTTTNWRKSRLKEVKNTEHAPDLETFWAEALG